MVTVCCHDDVIVRPLLNCLAVNDRLKPEQEAQGPAADKVDFVTAEAAGAAAREPKTELCKRPIILELARPGAFAASEAMSILDPNEIFFNVLLSMSTIYTLTYVD